LALAVVLVGVAAAACGSPEEVTEVLPAGHAVYRTDLKHKVNTTYLTAQGGLRPTTSNVRLTSPRAGISFDWVYVTPALTFGQAREFGMARSGVEKISAGPGRELLLAVSGDGVSSEEAFRGEPADASVTVRIAGAELPVPELPTHTTSGAVLVLNIPASSDPEIALTDLGKTQTASLRTGERGGHDAAAYYPFRSGAATLFSPGLGITTPPAQAYITRLDITAALGAYDADRGWAPPGQAWLLLSIESSGSSQPSDTTGWQVDLDLSKHLTVAGKGLPTTRVPGKVTAVESQQVPFRTALPVKDPHAIGSDLEFVMTGDGTLRTSRGKLRTEFITAGSDVSLHLAVPR